MPSEPEDLLLRGIATLEEDFDFFVRDPLQWQIKGRTLFRAACILFDIYEQALLDMLRNEENTRFEQVADIELFQPAAMLAGLSIELTLKSIIVSRHPDRLQPGKRSEWGSSEKINAHDLLLLAREAGLPDELDQELLSILTEFSIWKGRYPSNVKGNETYYGDRSASENFAGTNWNELYTRYKTLFNTVSEVAQSG